MTGQSDLLDLIDFKDCAFPPRDFVVSADTLKLGDETSSGVRLVARYDRHSDLSFHSDDPVPLRTLIEGLPDAEMSGTSFPDPVTLLTVAMNSSHTVFVPQSQPVFMDFDIPAVTARGVITNGPSLKYCNSRLDFAVDGFEISVRENPALKPYRDESRLHRSDCIATASIAIRATDGNVVSGDTAYQKLAHLVRFFTLLRGGNCGLGNVRGEGPNGELAFIYLGFGKSDPFWVERGWCDAEVIAGAPDVYAGYCAALQDEDAAAVIRRAIDYYRASNVARGTSPEMALISSYAALEALVPHILSTRGGWSASLFGRQAPFYDLLKATAALVGIQGDPFEHSPRLLAKARADANGDAYEVLSLLRNRVTHHKKGFRYSGGEMLEVWHLSQWLCELLLLFLIGYRGKMNDRRRLKGWLGPSVSVPLK